MFSFRLWIRERFHKLLEVQAAAKLERLFLRGRFDASVKTYLLEHEITIDQLLEGITDDETREEIRRRYVIELKQFIRFRMSRRLTPGKNKPIPAVSRQDEFQFGHAVITYIRLGGKLADAFGGIYTADTLCSCVTQDIARRFIYPQMMKEKIPVTKRHWLKEKPLRTKDNVD